MSDWLDFEMLKSRWKISDIEILDYINDGLTPYKLNQKAQECPNYCHKYYRLHFKFMDVSHKLGFINELQKKTENQQSIPFYEIHPNDLSFLENIFDITLDEEQFVLNPERNKIFESAIEGWEEEKKYLLQELSTITDNDEETVDWQYFEKPKSIELIKKVLEIMQESIFSKSGITKIEFDKNIPVFQNAQKKYQPGADAVILDSDIVLDKDEYKYFLLVHKSGENLYEMTVPLRPQYYNIIFFIYEKRKYYSLSELTGGLGKSVQSISNAIRNINKNCKENNVKEIFHCFPGHKWGLSNVLNFGE